MFELQHDKRWYGIKSDIRAPARSSVARRTIATRAHDKHKNTCDIPLFFATFYGGFAYFLLRFKGVIHIFYYVLRGLYIFFTTFYGGCTYFLLRFTGVISYMRNKSEPNVLMKI